MPLNVSAVLLRVVGGCSCYNRSLCKFSLAVYRFLSILSLLTRISLAVTHFFPFRSFFLRKIALGALKQKEGIKHSQKLLSFSLIFFFCPLFILITSGFLIKMEVFTNWSVTNYFCVCLYIYIIHNSLYVYVCV